MPRYPHSRLFRRPEHSIVISGPHIQILDTNTGDVLHSTATIDEQVSALTSGHIRCAALSHCGKYLATSGDDKKLVVWEVRDLTFLSSREIPKKSTCINFIGNNDILVADKFGDIFRHPLHPNSNEPSGGFTSGALASGENYSGGELILGHASLLTTFLLTADEQYVITADRDEHIRVSWYPQGYMIESYCLGHEKFISAVHIPSFSPGTLISGGGDSVLRLWDWISGKPLRTIDIFSTVQPFIVVKPPKKKRGWKDEDHIKGKRRRGRNKAKLEDAEGTGDRDAEDSHGFAMHEEQLEGSGVFVVHKIASIPLLAQIIVFSVVGATAIFWFSMDDSSEPSIRHQPFHKPVIDFNLEEDGSLWVLLDADWSSHGVWTAGEGDASDCLEVRQWTSNNFSATDPAPLALSLNSCTLPTTEADLEALDLYSDLLLLPKNIEAEGEDRTQDISEITVSDAATTMDSGSNEKGMSKRELGRLKHKKALRYLQDGICGGGLDVEDSV